MITSLKLKHVTKERAEMVLQFGMCVFLLK